MAQSRLALLPDDIIGQIVGFGGINKLAEEALRAIQRHWRATRKIARRRAAYHIQYFAGVNFRWVHLLNYDYYDETNIPRIRKFNRLRTALRHRT